jgi:hypothetical protein
MEVEKRKMIHLFKNTSLRTRNIYGDLEYRRKKYVKYYKHSL